MHIGRARRRPSCKVDVDEPGHSTTRALATANPHRSSATAGDRDQPKAMVAGWIGAVGTADRDAEKTITMRISMGAINMGSIASPT